MTETPDQIHLHAGAHKTATTHLQVLLRVNKPYLANAGVHVATPPELERWMRDFRLQQLLPAWGRPLLNHRLQQAAPNNGCWLFSEENFAGRPGDLLNQPVLFTDLPRRLVSMQKLFPQAQITLFFAVRSYESFLLSNYLELIRAMGYFPWSKFHDPGRIAGYSWLELCDRVCRVMPQENIVLWRYEDFRTMQGAILARLTGSDDTAALLARYQKTTTRPSLSARAIEQLQTDKTPRPGTGKHKAYLLELNERYPAGDQYPRLQPWDTTEAESLQAKYRSDCEAIRERYPAIQMLLP